MEEKEEMSFEELYNASIKETKLEKTVTGKIIEITSKGEIFVDLGYKADGIVPRQEYSYNLLDDPKDELKVGDTITCDVLKLNDGLGNVLLSYKRAKARNSHQEFEKKVKNNEIFEQEITEVNEKGLITSYQGIRIFIPLSLSGITRDEKVEDFKGKTVKFKIIEYDPRNKKIIGSIKEILEEEKEKELKKFWEEVEVGKEYIGEVTSISTYGAFVKIGFVQGLLHISEMAWGKNANPNDILKVGESIKVTVKSVDKENKRLLLSYGDKGPNPWEEAKGKYNVNDIVKVKAVKLMPFGAFVELEKGIEGLVHISQICEKRIAKPEEELKVGQHVNAKILDIDYESQKLELSIKELEGTSNEYKEEI